MFVIQQFLLLCFASVIETNLIQNTTTRTTMTLSRSRLNSNTNRSIGKIIHANSSVIQTEGSKISTVSPVDTVSSDTTSDEIKKEVFVNDLLDTVEEPTVISVPELHKGPHYELEWSFIDKDTILVTFELFSVPTSLIENNIYSESAERKLNILAIMAAMPSRPLKTITSLQYFIFIIRPYHKNREIILKMEKLHIKNTTSRLYPHFSNSLRLTALNHKEKYSICISYYQTNTSTGAPDLLLCQDIINDYSKFSELRTDPKHGLLFITTQYSIIIALLIVLQSAFTMRKRRITEIVAKHIAITKHNIRTTFSSVSLGRQSCSSLDAAEQQQQQQHTANSLAVQREPTINEEGGIKKRIISSPVIVLSEPSMSVDNGATNSDENEPFLKQIPSKNHVHFLLGTGEDDDDNETEDVEVNTIVSPRRASAHREPYCDQADALLSMTHILDTNKPWSRHSDHTSPV